MRAAIVLLLALSAPAHAQRAEADAAFERGRVLMKEGNFKEACEAFEASLRFEHTIGTLYNLGLCHERLGKLASAWSELKQVAATDTNKGRAADAAKRVAALEKRLTKMRLVISEPAPGLVVERDGLDVTALVGQEVPVDPRTYSFTATAPGRKTHTTQVALAREGETIEISIPALSTSDEPTPEPVTPAGPTGYPMQLARRPWLMPDGKYEVGAVTIASTSDSMFEQEPIDAGVFGRIGIQMFEIGLRATFHARYPQRESTRPNPWQTVTASFGYAIKPMFVGRLEYTRYHPVGDLGKGSDLRIALLRKQLVMPKLALAGSAGFVYAERGDENELTGEGTFGVQATATARLSFEALAELGLNAGGDLYSHNVSLGFGTLGMYAVNAEIDVFLRLFVGLLPAVDGSSSNDFRSVVIGLNWRP